MSSPDYEQLLKDYEELLRKLEAAERLAEMVQKVLDTGSIEERDDLRDALRVYNDQS